MPALCWMIAGVILPSVLVAATGAQAQSSEIDRLNKKVTELYREQSFEEAIPLAQRALELAQRSGPDHRSVGTPLNNLASLYEALGRYAEAEPLRMRVVGVFERSLGPNNPDLAVPLAALGMHYQSTGRYREAEVAYRRALDIRERARKPKDHYVGHLMERLGSVAEAKGQYAEAEALYKRALAAGERAVGPEHLLVGNALLGLASAYYRLGRLDDAEALYRRALPIIQRAWGAEHYMVARTLNNIGLVYAEQGRVAEAEAFYKRALAMREAIFGEDHFSVAETLNNLAVLYRDQRKFADAEPLIRRDLAIGEKSLGRDHPDVAIALENLAGLYDDQGRNAEARPLYERALQVRIAAFGPENPDVALSLGNLAYNALAQSEWTRALDLFQRSFDTSIRWSRRGGAAAERSKAGKAPTTFSGFIKAAFRVATADKARYAELADALFSRAQSATGSTAAASLAQMSARLAKGDDRLARIARERQDLMGEWLDRDRELVKAASQERDKRDMANETRVRTRLAAIDTRIGEIDAELARGFPEYVALANPAPLSIAEVQAELRADEALVLVLDTPEWAPTPEEAFVWVVTKTDRRWFRSELGTAAMMREVAALRCGLDYTTWTNDGGQRCADLLRIASDKRPQGNDLLPFDHARAHKLYQGLFGTVADLIKGKHLLVVPSGPLSQLPLQVLVTRAPAGNDHRSAAWLPREHPITVLPAVSSLKALRRVARPSAAAKTMIGFGNPLLDGDQNDAQHGAYYKRLAAAARSYATCAASRDERAPSLRGLRRSPAPLTQQATGVDLAQVRLQTPLPETADELCSVARALNADLADIRLGAGATEREVKALSDAGTLAQYRIVHFATHGTLAGQLTGTSEPGLILTPPAAASVQDDGYLSASEITTLKLDADWVILSACNTAAAGAAGAEALSGLARAFFYAQARALLVSHWEVDSAATVKLIGASVGETARGPGIGRAEALRRAMLAMIDKGSPNEAHPSYWAPFVLVGEGAAPR